MKQLFVDANTLLDFYRYGQDDIEQVGKIIHLIEENELQIFTNRLLQDEVNRMREAELSRIISDLRSQSPQLKAPVFAKSLTEYEAVTDALKSASDAHGKLVSKINELVGKHELDADRLIQKLFEKSVTLDVGESTFQAAFRRNAMNNPPRKKGDSLSDALHWEALLNDTRVWDIFIVTRDGDFASDLNPNRVKDFLRTEWTERKGDYWKTVRLYKSLSSFFKAQFPDIVLSSEAEKAELISQLYFSSSFQETHDIIAQLKDYKFFTAGQTVRMFEALYSNNQIYWISSDSDIRDFYLSLKDKSYWVPESMHADIASYLEVDDLFFIPF